MPMIFFLEILTFWNIYGTYTIVSKFKKDCGHGK